MSLYTAQITAHSGRRLEVIVVDNKLAAHGYLSTSPTANDMGGNPRPYWNALHDHWQNFPGATVAATAELPSFDVYSDADSFIANNSSFPGGGSAEELAGADLVLTLVDAFKWTSPASTGPINLELLTVTDPEITIERSHGADGDSINTTDGGSLTLASHIAASGADDLDLEFSIIAEPSGQLYALQWVLSTTKPGIASSDSIYTILSPDRDPDGPGGKEPSSMVGLHHPSLHLESQLGSPIPVPEPGASVLFIWGLVTFWSKSRRCVK